MFTNYTFTVVEKFMRYVQVDTQSDPASAAAPTTEKQKNLGSVLAEELKAMGLADAHMDEYGYVYATIPSNITKQVPVICFCSHVDTAPDCSGTHVKPILHKQYNGADIVLPDDATQVISVKDYPYLQQHIGQDIITASGLTLLGADDKSGVAEIMDMANYLLQHPEVKHGEIKILFTPDEEVGKGTAHVNLKKLGAEFAYTLDGGELGTFEDETFSADAAKITVNGVIAHPGYAKDKLVNALKIAGEILAALPAGEFSPETTSGREGFVHPVAIGGIAEKATIDFIVRDFTTANLVKHEARLKGIVEEVLKKHPRATMTFEVHEQYRNMKEVLINHPQVGAYAEEAYQRAGLQVTKEPIRGGTDGSRLSFMGLPCPNVFTGMQAIHSKHEWIGVRDMHKAVEVLVHLAQVWAEK
ncbi:peptidase T. Metallo peptidase. MEROPS family M20B [Filimonas lacunae]|uniref:Peptidase T n=1 Tax=Filimonas lacunae TaxID=477680 RepID=A0A173MLQ3_9BACT|nr:peptidase T [Filimonas lacunae]BAV08406.1 tripeptide aminopeptidase [Filimonas lacunae]SIT33521.1 peptidase T. Metallo peptidase. MEROPS family M20B [Filimonas lacunae]